MNLTRRTLLQTALTLPLANAFPQTHPADNHQPGRIPNEYSLFLPGEKEVLLGGYLPAAHTGSGVICRDGGYMDYRIEWDFPGVIYDRAMVGSQFFDDDFKAAVQVAGAQARIETLQAGVPVFYRDRVRKLNIIEYSNGKKFEIRFLDGAPGDRNYEVIRELNETAA